MQVAEGEEDRCDQEEDKKPPTEEVIKKILFLTKRALDKTDEPVF